MNGNEQTSSQADEWGTFTVEQRRGHYPRWPNETMVKIIFGNYLNHRPILDPGSSVLDVGCGFGNNLLPFLDMNCECHGVDIHPDMIEVTASILGERGYRPEIQLGSNRDLPYEDETFDLLLSVNTLHYEGTEEKVRSALDEFHRVVKPGGTVFVSTVSPAHDIHRKSVKVGERLFQIKDWDFRDGQQFFFFHDQEDLGGYLEGVFSRVEVGHVIESLVTSELGFLVAAATR